MTIQPFMNKFIAFTILGAGKNREKDRRIEICLKKKTTKLKIVSFSFLSLFDHAENNPKTDI